MKVEDVNKKILYIEFKKPNYIIKVQFSWKSWFKTKVREELFYSSDLKYFHHVHTGFSSTKWWGEYFTASYNESKKIDTWLNGETYLINNGLSENNIATDIIEESIIGKIFKVKEKFILTDKSNKNHTLNKDDCVTVVDIIAMTNNSGYIEPVFCVLYNNKKLYIKSIPSDFEQV